MRRNRPWTGLTQAYPTKSYCPAASLSPSGALPCGGCFNPHLWGTHPVSRLDRRQLLRGLAGAGALTALDLTPGTPAADQRQSDLIKAENDREGTIDWQLTYTRIDPKTKCTRFGGGL